MPPHLAIMEWQQIAGLVGQTRQPRLGTCFHQGRNNRTRLLFAGMFAFMNKLGQSDVHTLQIGQLCLDFSKPLLGNAANRLTIYAVFQRKQLGYLVKRKAQLLRPFDEAYTVAQRDRIVPVCARCVWNRE